MMQKESLFALFHKEQRLIVVQLVVFSIFVALTIVVGAVVYNKTSIHDKEEMFEQKRSIEGGFTGLRKSVEESAE